MFTVGLLAAVPTFKYPLVSVTVVSGCAIAEFAKRMQAAKPRENKLSLRVMVVSAGSAG